MQKPGDYKLTQVFGDKTSAQKVAEEDIISAVEFDQSGKYLSLGDRAGRLIIFDAQQVKGKKSIEYNYYTELQSHLKEFDPLKSVDIDEKINDITWLKPQGRNLYVLTTNCKTIKLWKLSQKPLKKVVRSAGKELAMPKLQVMEDGMVPTLKKTFPSLHSSVINSVNQSANQEYLLSSDESKVFLWNIEEPSKAFVACELRTDPSDEVPEQITCSNYHPSSDSLFTYATSKGVLKMGDMRVSALCDNTAIDFRYESSAPKNFFTDIVSTYSSAIFLKNERYIAARDFLSIKIWDLAMSSKPISVIPVHQSLKSKLCEMYENQSILERFSLSCSPDSRNLITGSFNSNFHIIDTEGSNMQYELNFNRRTINRQINAKIESLGNLDYSRKTVRTAFHPTSDTAVVACLNCFFIYNAQ